MEPKVDMELLDRLRGSIICVAVGDALGAPHEFRGQRKDNYNGILHIQPHMRFRWVSRKDKVGQYTDDTEMTLANMRSVVRQGGYDEEDIILSYETWAESSRAMGRNTRALFKGVKTVRGYRARFGRLVTANPPETWSQSNGALMRAAALSFLGEGAVLADCELTNPHPTTKTASKAYCAAIRMSLRTRDKKEVLAAALAKCGDDGCPVREVLLSAAAGEAREVNTRQKGWVLNAIYCAFFGFLQHQTFQEAVDAVIRMWGDADTNAAILGGLFGAYLGYSKVMEDERTSQNIQIVRTADLTTGENPRPERCRLDDFPELTEKYAALLPVQELLLR